MNTETTPRTDYRDIATFLAETLENGGGTFRTYSLADVDKDGWTVGAANGITSMRVRIAEEFTGRHYGWKPLGERFAEAYLTMIRYPAMSQYIGSWVDEGYIILDAVDIVQDTDNAINAALERGEKAVYHLSRHITLEVS
jgi:hypothetical protein